MARPEAARVALGLGARKDRHVLECVVNVSEGRDDRRLRRLEAAVGHRDLLDRHSCVHHNRSVFTLVGEDAPRRLTRAAVAELDLRDHEGAHPRLGVVDVVPFVALGSASPNDAQAARDRFATWAAEELGLPCFLYGPERTLPEVRRQAFASLLPDTGPSSAHPTAGAVAVGVRPVLVAYNLWLAEPDLDLARRIAAAIRGRSVRALGLTVGDDVQVSMNLIDPLVVGPAVVWDAVAALAPIGRAELVGLVPASVVKAAPAGRRAQLGLADDVTIERRLADRRLTAAPGP